MNAGIQLLLPGLFDLPLEELDETFLKSAMPGLNRILGLATPRANPDYSIDAMLRTTLALKPEKTGLPMARGFADEAADANRSVLVEAIHLRADMHNAIAMPILQNPDNLKDVSILINDLSDIFKVDFDINAVAEGLYLLRLKAFDAPTHYPHPLSVLGKSINPFIEQSREVLPWYQLLNEIQMFLHQHAVNERRMAAGKPVINSLWAWGAGDLPRLVDGPVWYGDDLVLNGFAGALGLPVRSCADLGEDVAREQAVIVDLRLLQLLKAGLDRPLDHLLLDIERTLLAPLLRSLGKHRQTLRLRAGYRFDFEMKPGARLKFWRRPGSLGDWRG